MAPHRLLTVTFAVSICVLTSAEDAVSPAKIYAAYKSAVLKVTATGELYNHERELSTGSGFVLNRGGLAVTSNHVVFDEPDNYKSVTITVSIGPNKEAIQRQATVVATDKTHDIALLQVDGGPMPGAVLLGQSESVAIGDEIAVMGFPLKYDLSIVRGLLSSAPATDKWQTDSALNRGNSGGPVFDRTGQVIGVAAAGAVMADGIPVEGIKFLVPIDSFRDTIAQVLPPPAPPVFTGRGAARGAPIEGPAVISGRGRGTLPPLPDPRTVAPTQTFSQTFTVSRLQETHAPLTSTATQYTQTFSAEPGYRFTDAQLNPLSANAVSGATVHLEEGNTRAVVTFTLTSGPMWNQVRAWYHASLITEQALMTP